MVLPNSNSVILPSQGRFLAWALLGALLVAYGSIGIGPSGFGDYVPLDWRSAWTLFLSTRWVVHGSDQRPDWMGNLTVFIPLGFMMTGAVWPRQRTRLKWPAAILTLMSCIIFILAIKFAQLYFPPRTVTMNYILAQTLGSLIGIAFFCAIEARLPRLIRAISVGGWHAVLPLLACYTAALLLFFLSPFDFVLSSGDLHARFAALPHLFLAWPGESRPPALRVVLLVVDTLACAPIGMLLAVSRRQRSVASIAVAGAGMMIAVTIATMFVISGAPFLPAVLYRTLGVVFGAIAARRIERLDPEALLHLAWRAVPPLVPVYIVGVLFVNQLLTLEWRTPQEALATLDWRTLVPLWDFYIVSKAQASASLVVHVAMYGPIGFMMWLRRAGRRGGPWLAALFAIALSTFIEVGRSLRPGLSPDISDVLVAAVAAWAAYKVSVLLWQLPGQAPAGPAAPAIRDSSAVASSSMTSTPFEIRPVLILTAAGAAVSIVSIGIIIRVLVSYPLWPLPLALMLGAYGVLLFRWPAFWLLLIPSVVPALDLAPWTGARLVTEADLFVLLTIGILAVRAPPKRVDLIPGPAGIIVAIFFIPYLISICRGLSLPAPVGGSSNPYLEPDNAIALAKGFFTALALVPFLRRRQRESGDALQYVGKGMLIGLLLVAIVALIERALFPGIFNFTGDYRIVATFASMHLGGGYVGAYFAMTLPFVFNCLVRPRPASIVTLLVVIMLGGYALVVTFARTAYVAALLAMMVALAGWAVAIRQSRRNWSMRFVLAVAAVAGLGSIVAISAFDTSYMSGRLQTVWSDFRIRENNWRRGLALEDHTISAMLFGMGLGTYPRIVLAGSVPNHAPTNFVVRRDDGKSFLSLTAGSALYLVQRVSIIADSTYTLRIKARSPGGGGSLDASLCENVLLYSVDCRGGHLALTGGQTWTKWSFLVSTRGLDEHSIAGVLRRPVILSLSDPSPGTRIDIADVQLTDLSGREVVANGDFNRGMARWFFTDDNHLVWRMKDQYLMTMFQTGIVGLGALLLLIATALLGAIRAIRRGDLAAVAILASLVSFLCSGCFDYVLESPPLATLFYLTTLSAVTVFYQPLSRMPRAGEKASSSQHVSGSRVSAP